MPPSVEPEEYSSDIVQKLMELKFRKIVRNLIHKICAPLIVLLALFLIFEEWLWDQLTLITRWVSQFELVQSLEKAIQKLSPEASLVIFVIPALALIPFKIFAVLVIARGHPFLGLGIILLAKVTGTAFVAEIFSLTRDKVLTIRWFAALYHGIKRAMAWGHRYLQQLPLYQMVRAKLRQIRSYIRL